MPRDEHQTRIELINPALYLCGWGNSLIREEKTPGGTEFLDDRPRKLRGSCIFRDIREMGFTGKYSIVSKYILKARLPQEIPAIQFRSH